MTNIPMKNVEDNMYQIYVLFKCGCETIRPAVTSLEDVKIFDDQHVIGEFALFKIRA
jgi:4-hydroxy-3-methylbut-2-en-1-yl diphosphate synthase IspG/GcpE